MIMRAKQDGDYLILELEGHLDYETTTQFRETCVDLIQESGAPSRVVFNLEKLKFVGSSGINQFIKVMKEFNNRNFIKPKPKFCALSNEFVRVFRAYQTTRNPFDIFDNEGDAVASFDAPPKRTRKTKTN